MEKDSIGQGGLSWCGVRLSLLLLVTARLAVVSSKDNNLYTVSELCQDSFMKQHNRMIEGAVLASRGERNLKCEVTFQTASVLQRFMLRFERLQLDCNDHLYIYDGAHVTEPHKADLSCRSTLQNVGTLYTKSNFVTLKYVTDQWGPKDNGFRLLITAFKDKKHTCLHFRCETTNFCVDRELTCDGVNHCGDGSDESTNLARCPPTPLYEVLGVSGALLVAIVTSVALLCCACGVAVVVCVYRRNRALHQPPSQSQGYPIEVGGTMGTNGTFGSVMVEKPPPYPGAPQHTSVNPPDTSPGNLCRPSAGVGCSTRLMFNVLFCLCQ
ncbi:uncharacterized protein LOC135094781 isoform X1 [Scylla paramamosain]|uniref:uncharacterized protein LOC135094781 isoform X1 n=1 Tax=Scylla paramamosain TaxID=85552 RepID=UPI003083370E